MKTALLIVDVQRGLFDDEPRPYEADTVVERINALAGRARAHGVPVVFIQHERASGNLAHGTESWQLERHLRTEPETTSSAKRRQIRFSAHRCKSCWTSTR